MKKAILGLSALILAVGITCAHAETNTDKLPSLAKEIKNALPAVFGQEGFASATEGSAGFGDMPGGIDIGAAISTNRDITFAALQAVVPAVVPPVGPVGPQPEPPKPSPSPYLSASTVYSTSD